MSRDLTSATGWPVGTAAERVGVSVSTLRSWEARYGLGPRGRTEGGHRRYTAADVARLQRLHRLAQSGVPTGAAAAAVLAPPSAGGRADRVDRLDMQRAAERLRAAVDAFDVAAAGRLARRLLSDHGVVAAWTQVFTPILQNLGQRWRDTGSGIECEHLAADLIEAALAEHRRRQRLAHPNDATGTVLAAAPEEAHTLPIRALATALAEHGVASTVFDNMPAAALRSAVDQTQPAVVLVFARGRATADLPTLRSLAGAVPLLCAGGAGWRGRLPRGVMRVPDLPSAVDLIRAAAGDAASPDRPQRR